MIEFVSPRNGKIEKVSIKIAINEHNVQLHVVHCTENSTKTTYHLPYESAFTHALEIITNASVKSNNHGDEYTFNLDGVEVMVSPRGSIVPCINDDRWDVATMIVKSFNETLANVVTTLGMGVEKA